ncbi:MAG: 50S ribosomal protein L11 methyltransferase [Bacteroidetes bacterium B1(2017)]|nr:MAG: 50S ribosomal protein L11 methyltransferase [Bacteroidetes bacterium B1(2017)]
MQNYILCKVICEPNLVDVLIAELGDLNYEGFIETDTGFEAYLPESDFNEASLNALFLEYNLPVEKYSFSTVAQQNWNAEWESNFEPVSIDKRLRIRAPFHEPDKNFDLELIIQPKTSFGTGHHETTFTIMELMLGLDFTNKNVFDYGSGTGILAILASKLGAKSIYANDIDTWAAENIFENMALNNVSNIEFLEGDLKAVPSSVYEVILANINKNILLSSFIDLFPLLSKGGILLISGFYESDLPDLMKQAESCGFKLVASVSCNQWTAAHLTK